MSDVINGVTSEYEMPRDPKFYLENEGYVTVNSEEIIRRSRL